MQSKIRVLKRGAFMLGLIINAISRSKQEECWCATGGSYAEEFLHPFLTVK